MGVCLRFASILPAQGEASINRAAHVPRRRHRPRTRPAASGRAAVHPGRPDRGDARPGARPVARLARPAVHPVLPVLLPRPRARAARPSRRRGGARRWPRGVDRRPPCRRRNSGSAPCRAGACRTFLVDPERAREPCAGGRHHHPHRLPARQLPQRQHGQGERGERAQRHRAAPGRRPRDRRGADRRPDRPPHRLRPA